MTERTAWSLPRAPIRVRTRRVRTGRPGIRRPRIDRPARLLAAAAVLMVAGCLETTGTAVPASTGAAPAGAPVSARTDPALVPTPELFVVDAWALWDGRPTLGGVWVALPEIDEARQVRLTNTETGAAVDGALIRRDRDQIGPQLIISAEAAQSLGIAPNRAVGVQVVALVRPPAGAARAGATAVEGAAVKEAAAPEAPVDQERPAPETMMEAPAEPQIAAAAGAGTATDAAAPEKATATEAAAETIVADAVGATETPGGKTVAEPTPGDAITPQTPAQQAMAAITTGPAAAPVLPVPRPSGPPAPIRQRSGQAMPVPRPSATADATAAVPPADEIVAPPPLPAAATPEPGPAAPATSGNNSALAPRDSAPAWADPGVER